MIARVSVKEWIVGDWGQPIFVGDDASLPSLEMPAEVREGLAEILGEWTANTITHRVPSDDSGDALEGPCRCCSRRVPAPRRPAEARRTGRGGRSGGTSGGL